MKKIILYCVFFLALVVETSCGSRTSDTTSEKPALPHKTKGVDSEQKQAIRESLNITFEDVLGNRQKLKTEEVNKNDVGAKLCDERIGCFVEDNHFYFKTDREDYMNTVIEVFQDKGKKLGEFDWEPGDWLQNWGKYGEKLYLVLRKENELSNEKQTVKFISVNLNSWKTEIINCFEIYGSFLDVFVYNEKIYINDLDCSENLDEIDMNGEKTRTISLGKDRGKADRIHLQGIMDGKVYFLQSDNNCSVLKSKELKTGKEKKVLQYEQPAYDKRKFEYASSYFRTSGNNLFIMDEFYIKDEEVNPEPRYILYRLPIKNGGKMKRMLNQKIVDCDFSGEEIFYIDAKHLLHRKNLKKGTDKIISKRKLEKVRCIKEGIFVNKYKEGEAYDEDAVEEDVIYYMDFDGKHEKKIAEI